MPSTFKEKIELIFLEKSGIVLASLIASLEDIALAEDLLQETFLIAYEKWQKDGIPPNPTGWLTLTAKRKAIDKFRRNKVLEGKIEILENQISKEFINPSSADIEAIPDERLKLIFTCCHPSLSLKAQIALTLHTLGGLTTEEIAKAFLVPTTTLAQRLVRAKQKIKKAKIPYRVPPIELLQERLESLLYVLYLIFNEGYNASTGNSIIKIDLSEEAIRLMRVLLDLINREESIPESAEAMGLLALMLLHDSRKSARMDSDGQLIVLDEQNREFWHNEKIVEGQALLDKAMQLRSSGPYQVQAAISALHAQAESAIKTDWPQIIALYQKLYSFSESPIVALNLAVAISNLEGASEGLRLLNLLKDHKEMIDYVPYYAARADMYFKRGEKLSAISEYQNAIKLSDNEMAINYFNNKIASLTL